MILELKNKEQTKRDIWNWTVTWYQENNDMGLFMNILAKFEEII